MVTNHKSYSLFSSGIFGERLPLRYYLSAGMLLSGLFTSLFGLGYFWNIHMLWYFVLIQVRAPILHSDLCSIMGRIAEAASPSQTPPGGGRFGLGITSSQPSAPLLSLGLLLPTSQDHTDPP